GHWRSEVRSQRSEVRPLISDLWFARRLFFVCTIKTMEKNEVAAILDEIATLLELQGENPFRCNAYTKAARAIGQLENNLVDVIAAGELDQIPGIGATLRDKITLLATTDHLPFYEDLKAKTPPGLFVLLRLPSVGPKKVKAL